MSRRNEIATVAVQRTTHAGLWLDKYISGFERAPTSDETPQANLVVQVTNIDAPDEYKPFFERWIWSLQQAGVPESQMRKASVEGRLCVGLGGEAVLETAITLHRTYGLPYIPGSALKGLAARYAHKHLEGDGWRKGGEAHTIMFGNTKSAGYLTFFDALYVAGSGRHGKALWPDVITVHHPEYYQGHKPPADWDSPIPVPFLSATGEYLIAIGGDEAWAKKAFEILCLALLEEGVGAKTSSGYGRMRMEMAADANAEDSTAQATQVSPPLVDQRVVETFKVRLGNMPHAKVASEINAVYQQWKTLEATTETKSLIAQAILGKVQVAGRAKQSQDKTWYQELQSFIQV